MTFKYHSAVMTSDGGSWMSIDFLYVDLQKNTPILLSKTVVKF